MAPRGPHHPTAAHTVPEGKTSHGGGHLGQHPQCWEAHKPLADLPVAGPSQVVEQWVCRSRAAAGVPCQGTASREATAAPRAGLAPHPEPGELIQPPLHSSLPGLQTHTGPHTAWVIQARKGVIKIHSKLMSAISVLMSVAERHSRSQGGGEKDFDFPTLISKRGGLGGQRWETGSGGGWGACGAGAASHAADGWDWQFNPISQIFHPVFYLTASTPCWPFPRHVTVQDPSR